MSGLPAATEHFLTCLEKAEADLKAVARRFEEEFQERCGGVAVRCSEEGLRRICLSVAMNDAKLFITAATDCRITCCVPYTEAFSACCVCHNAEDALALLTPLMLLCSFQWFSYFVWQCRQTRSPSCRE